MFENLSGFNKKKRSFAIALTLLLSISAAIAILPAAYAHQPPWQIPTYSYVSAAPNPIGVGQDIAIIFWLDIPPPTAAGATGDRWQKITVTITKPDGTVVSKGPYNSDPVGSGYFLYSPDATGTYTVRMNFPGQVLSRAHPVTGALGSDSAYINDTYLQSNATTTFTVQADPVTYFEEAPLPRSYWTRPINENNQQWATIASHWLGTSEYGATYLKYNPYGWAPSTAHVMWTYPLSWGGIVGGGHAISDSMSFYSGTQYQLKFSNPIIMYGNVYFSLPQNNANAGNGVTCVNLHTGETVWTNTAINSVTIGQLYDFESPNQHGTTGMYLWTMGTATGSQIRNPGAAAVAQLSGTYSLGLGGVTTSTTVNGPLSASGSWIAVDPQTGKLLFNLTSVASGTRAYGPQGEWLIYNIGRAPGNPNGAYTYLYQWNNTKLPGNDAGSGIQQWIPGVTNYNMSAAYDWNVTLSQPLPVTYSPIGSFGGGFAGSAAYNATTGIYTNAPTIMRVFPGNCIFGQSSGLQQTPGTSFGVFGTPDPYTLWAINLDPKRGAIGQVMWQKTYPAPEGNLTVCLGPTDGENNVFTIYFRETMQWSGYDLTTGEYMWGPTAGENAWNYYTGTTGLTNPIGLGYGHLYAAGHGGVLYAYNIKTGNLDFTYGNDPNDPKNSTITTATAYGNYPTQVAAIANNKIYLVEEEHSLNAPAYHGAATRCVDAFTGKELWKIYGISSHQMQAVADGYYTWLNLNEMQIYAMGPGPSSTSVSANPGAVALGNGVMISGSVLDQSPNIKLKGTPAIADADQGPWMEYMVQGSRTQPLASGVNVQLTVIDSTGTPTELGTVTSDSSGLFHKLWTPTAEGEYVIYATFAGSDSYGPSSATTAIGVTAAVAPVITPTPTPVVTPTPTPTATTSPSIAPSPPGAPLGAEFYVIIAAVVIIAVIAAIAIALRKRK